MKPVHGCENLPDPCSRVGKESEWGRMETGPRSLQWKRWRRDGGKTLPACSPGRSDMGLPGIPAAGTGKGDREPKEHLPIHSSPMVCPFRRQHRVSGPTGERNHDGGDRENPRFFFSDAGIFPIDLPRTIALPGITRTVMVQGRPMPDPRGDTGSGARCVQSRRSPAILHHRYTPLTPGSHSPGHRVPPLLSPDNNRKPGTLQDALGPRFESIYDPSFRNLPETGR